MSAHRDSQRARILAELREVATKQTIYVAQFEYAYGSRHPKTQYQERLLLVTVAKIAELVGGASAAVEASS